MVNLWGKQEGDIISKVGKWGLEGVKDLVQYRRAIKWRGKDSHLVLPLSSVLRLLGCLSSSREPGPRSELMQWGVETENDILRCLFLFMLPCPLQLLTAFSVFRRQLLHGHTQGTPVVAVFGPWYPPSLEHGS